jgi:acetyltransferase-like isoleucine patch superfamily enzyme
MRRLNRATQVFKNRGLIGFLSKLREHISIRFHSGYTIHILNMSDNVDIHPSSTLSKHSKIKTDGSVRIGEKCSIRDYAMVLPSKGAITIGNHSTLNPYSILYGHGGLEIGDGVRIASHTVVIPANHKFDSRDSPIWTQGLSKEGIHIEDDVWIGANCTVLDGVTVGEGSVVAAGAVVTESVPPYTVVAGVPAEPIDSR